MLPDHPQLNRTGHRRALNKYEICYPLEDDFAVVFRNRLRQPYAQQVTFFLRLSKSQVRAIPEAVKNHVLEWACELERRGVVGDNMTFSEQEKRQAQSIHFNMVDCSVETIAASSHQGKRTMIDSRNRIDNRGGHLDNRGGTINQARDIVRSFGELADRANSEEVADKLRRLALSINDVVAGLPDEVANKISRDAENFAKEAADSSPRREVLEMLGKVLSGAIATVASAAIQGVSPLIQAVIAAATAT